MYRVALVNMPFASAQLPSIALAQLRSRLDAELGDRVETEILHLTHDTSRELSPQLYDLISGSVQAVTSGLGDWFFKPVAFPDMEDNPEAYLQRHFAEHRQQMAVLKGVLMHKRKHAGAFIERLIDQYELDSYDLVGFTSMFSQNVACFAMARRLKERNPDICCVMGGANCETSMGRVISDNVPWIDYVFSGPGLVTFPKFVELRLAGQPERCAQIEGVYVARDEAASTGLALVDAKPQVGEELDIDVEVHLDYDDFLESLDTKLPAGAVKPMIMFETSRGCWWGERSHCTFCGLNVMTMAYRGMAPEKALDLLHDLFERYGDRVDHFQSVDNIMPREYLTDVLPKLETPDHLSIFYEVKADLKDHEMETMAAAGVTEIQPGIEAMNSGTLKLMRKGITSFQNIRFLKSCLTHGITPHWNLLVGFPQEPEEVYAKYVEDLPSLFHFPPPSGAFPVRFDRFSPYFKEAKDWGLELKPCDFYGMIYPFPEEELEAMAYFFTDTNYDAPYIGRTARWVGKLRGLIDQWQRLWADADEDSEPKLVLRDLGDGKVVYDSRGGQAVEHELDATDEALLVELQRHRKVASLVKALDGVDEAEVERRLKRLQDLRLVFEEREMYMSVVSEDPLPADFVFQAPAETAARGHVQ